MALAFRPRIDWNDGVAHSWTALLSQGRWAPRTAAGEGGSDIAASGVPEAFVVRWDQTLSMNLRIRESELQTVHDWWKWAASSGSTYTVYVDAANPGATGFTCWLQAPSLTDGFEPTRDDRYPWIWRLPLVHRNASDALMRVAMGSV